MTYAEFQTELNKRDAEWRQLASEAWHAWTDKERAEATLADLEADVQDASKSMEEMWGPDKKLREALEAFGYDADLAMKEEFYLRHADAFLSGYRAGVGALDMDFWVQYEELLGEKISYEEYLFVDLLYEDDPLELIDVELSEDEQAVFGQLKAVLVDYRAGKVNNDAVVLLVEGFKGHWTPDTNEYVFGVIKSKANEAFAEVVCKRLEEEYSAWFDKSGTVDGLIGEAQEKAASFNNAKKLEEHTYGNHIFMRLEVDGEVHEVSNYAGRDGAWDTYSTTADGTDKRDAVIQAFNELY